MKRQTATKLGAIAIAIAASGITTTAQAAPSVELNGQPLATSVSPVVMNGRTLVPMRDIFEALGATVNYNSLTRGIAARRDNTNVNLQIGSRAALVNNQPVTLEQAPLVTRGSTLVPLRFVSEALGATVNWNGSQQLVSINQGGSAVAGARFISVPSGAVVPVLLDTDLSSATSRRGDTFMASVRSKAPGDSEFPAGTKLEGVVTESTPRAGDQPGVLGLDFRAAILPDGRRIPISGSLTALDNDSVVSSNGRIMAKPQTGGGSTAKNVLIGAGAGFVLGRVIKKNSTITAILGAAGGYLLGQKDKDKSAEARLSSGTELGVRIDRNVSYSDAAYYDQRATYFRM
ncbi:MAG TPA: copper amine oxidase N-terminal domain-containing protein [Abditibacteriaceae bacterium]|jgi:hypothetical protein